MEVLKREFLAGFREGWSLFWSPFVALFGALKDTWLRHVRAGSRSASGTAVSH